MGQPTFSAGAIPLRPTLGAVRIARADELELLIAIDDDACCLYADAGRAMDFGRDHPFALAEYERWREAIEAGRTLVAVTGEDEPVGFAVLTLVDGGPHLHQLSVRRSWMRRGIGRALVEHVVASIGHQDLSLTTYADLPWNRPVYERMGFVCLDAASCGEEMRQILAEERATLPAPGQRVAMVRRRPPP
jgi:GNAT superfamily N-acetyltransferase